MSLVCFWVLNWGLPSHPGSQWVAIIYSNSYEGKPLLTFIHWKTPVFFGRAQVFNMQYVQRDLVF